MRFIESLELIDQKSLISCLVHSDARIRNDALQLLFGGKKEPFSSYTFNTIIDNRIMEINLNESDQQDKFISTIYQFINGKLAESLRGKLGKESEVVAREYLLKFKALLFRHLEAQNNFQQNWEVL